MLNKKYIKFNIEGKELLFHNSIFGMETITLNNKIISKKWSLFGKDHGIKINNEIYKIKAGLMFFFTSKISLLKNGKILDEKKYTLHWSHIAVHIILMILISLIVINS